MIILTKNSKIILKMKMIIILAIIITTIIISRIEILIIRKNSIYILEIEININHHSTITNTMTKILIINKVIQIKILKMS